MAVAIEIIYELIKCGWPGFMSNCEVYVGAISDISGQWWWTWTWFPPDTGHPRHWHQPGHGSASLI